MKRLTLILFITSLLTASGLYAQVDSFHFQIKDTFLTKDAEHTFKFSVRESITDAEGLQFCIYYDPVNLQVEEVDSAFIPGMDKVTDFEKNPGGNPDKVSCIFYNFASPYTGHKLFNIRFKVLNNCRVRDVIRIMPIYRFDNNSSYFESIVIVSSGESIPIATEYLPFKSNAAHSAITIRPVNTYPNPLTTQSVLQFNCLHSTSGQMEIYDMAGRKVATSEVKINQGENNLSLNRNTFPASGLYQVMIYTENAIFSTRLLVN